MHFAGNLQFFKNFAENLQFLPKKFGGKLANFPAKMPFLPGGTPGKTLLQIFVQKIGKIGKISKFLPKIGIFQANFNFFFHFLPKTSSKSQCNSPGNWIFPQNFEISSLKSQFFNSHGNWYFRKILKFWNFWNFLPKISPEKSKFELLFSTLCEKVWKNPIFPHFLSLILEKIGWKKTPIFLISGFF